MCAYVCVCVCVCVKAGVCGRLQCECAAVHVCTSAHGLGARRADGKTNASSKRENFEFGRTDSEDKTPNLTRISSWCSKLDKVVLTKQHPSRSSPAQLHSPAVNKTKQKNVGETLSA